MSTAENNHGAFDAEERAILSAIVPDADPVEEVNQDLPGDTTAQPAAAAPAAPAAPVAQGSEQPATTQPAEANPATLAASTTAEQAEPAQPQGDVRAALRASRMAEKRKNQRIEQLERENEALRQGKGPVDTSISDEELAILEQDFPLQAKIVRQQRQIQEQLAQTAATNAPEPEFEPPSYRIEVQEVIDTVPDLLAWQHDPASQDKFARAVQYDQALAVDPDWQDRSASERFAEAARRTKAAFAPTTPAAPAAPAVPAAKPRLDAAQVIENAQVEGPKGISDFRGGASATPPTVNYKGMSDEQIMASLPVA